MSWIIRLETVNNPETYLIDGLRITAERITKDGCAPSGNLYDAWWIPDQYNKKYIKTFNSYLEAAVYLEEVKKPLTSWTYRLKGLSAVSITVARSKL